VSDMLMFVRYGRAIFPETRQIGPIERDIAAHIAYESDRHGGATPCCYEVTADVWQQLASEKAYRGPKTGSLMVCGVLVCPVP
jgi:hypothetical protein